MQGFFASFSMSRGPPKFTTKKYMYTCLLEGKISFTYIIKLYCSIRLDKKMRLLIVQYPTHSVLSILGLQNTSFAKLEGMRAVHVWDFSLHGNCFISSNKLAFSTFLSHTASSHGAGFVLKFMSISTKCKVDLRLRLCSCDVLHVWQHEIFWRRRSFIKKFLYLKAVINHIANKSVSKKALY